MTYNTARLGQVEEDEARTALWSQYHPRERMGQGSTPHDACGSAAWCAV